ncbi:hypothetical protein [Pantoea ananatis]|uniref:hypothetical protein n=1 Tax=Pantoea ananas TaxID=553 RepID=UPI0021F6F79D|nr:hypothetical protein [Pantoea ananatis]MCW0313986.1 hypothetical protein [Pantoea ananatis]BBL32370.1 hypothetical protein PAFU01_38180 [Pantoea ananatis]
MLPINSLILDTNLLLLFIVGRVDGGIHISKSKRLKKFSLKDFEKVELAVISANKVSITPYIATEVSNLIDMSGVLHKMMMEEAKRVIELFEHIEVDLSRDTNEHFVSFGITDNSLINLVRKHVVMTDDHRLTSLLYKENANNVLVIDYN